MAADLLLYQLQQIGSAVVKSAASGGRRAARRRSQARAVPCQGQRAGRLPAPSAAPGTARTARLARHVR